MFFRIIYHLVLFCADLAQYSICTSDSNACSQNFTYNTGDHFILNATIEFINSGMDCCHEGVTNPVWIVNATPGDPGVQVRNYRAFNPPGIYICTETSHDFTTNIARVTIINAKTTFQIMHLIQTDVDGKHHQNKSMIFNFYYAESEKWLVTTYNI